jgi:hypothetical protein
MEERDPQIKQMEDEDERHRVVCNILYSTGAQGSYEMAGSEGKMLIDAFGEFCNENKYQSFSVNLGRLDISSGQYKPENRLTVRFSNVLSIEIKEKEAQA